MKIKVIITGATGMVGEGVLHECLINDTIEEVLVIGRRPCGIAHPKLKEAIINDFFDLSAVKHLFSYYNACFFCLGVSSVGMKEEEYYRITYSLTMNFAENFSSMSPDSIFCYVSGTGTDSTEKGRLMWARVKGKTENDLMKLPFKAVYNFRPGFMKPTKGLKNALPFYKYINWFYPIGRRLFKNTIMLLSELGLAMINIALNGSDKHVLNVLDIKELASMFNKN
jgi:hypothetical protein